MKRILLFCFLLFAFQNVNSQNISGKVIDSLKNEPIAFANVTLEDGIRGTTTDIEGNFRLNIPANYTGRIVVSHVSYKKLKLPLSYLYRNQLIRLVPSITVLKELVFNAEENPAFRIVRQAVKNRKQHDPDYLDSYQYHSYNGQRCSPS